ncbi:MAG: hypothetical protein JWP91_2611 [Fibrobacteres bacterium]|nr:hypothetical protein [Fibrobacterota bacterium]
MQLEPHGLHHEFPEFSAKIHELKIKDGHFAKLFTEYDLLDHEVRRLEEAGSLLADAEMEKLKLNRVHLKDKLYAYLANPA